MSQAMLDSPETPEGSPATKNSFSRIIGAIVSPQATFEDVNRKPDWLIPLILITLVALATTYVFVTHADMVALISEQIEKSGRTAPPPEQLESAAKFGVITSYLGVLFGVPVVSLIEVGILFMIFNFFLAADTTFKKMFSVTMYAAIPGVVKGIIAIPILFVKQPNAFGNPADVVQSNLSLLIDPENKVMSAVGKSLDVFTLWSILLMATGYVAVSKNLKFKKSIITLIILWAVVTAILAVVAKIRG